MTRTTFAVEWIVIQQYLHLGKRSNYASLSHTFQNVFSNVCYLILLRS